MTYDTDLDGHRVGLTQDTLENSPSYGRDDEPDWDDDSWAGNVRGHSDRDRIVPQVGMV